MFNLFKKPEPKPEPVKKLLGKVEQSIRWTDKDDLVETFTFMLYTDSNGNRDYKLHHYGVCERNETYRKYLAPILIWKDGGALPDNFIPSRPCKIIFPEDIA